MRIVLRLLLLSTLLGFCIHAVPAQITAALQDDDDLQSWNDIQLTVQIEKKVDLVTRFTMRFGKNVSRLNDGRFQFGFAWKPTKSLSINPYYWYIDARNALSRFNVEHRLSVAVTYRFPTKSFGLSHRSIFERRLREVANTWRYRAMLTVEKNIPEHIIPKAKWFIADEVFYDSATGRFSRNRVGGGISKTITKNLTWDIFYTRQNDGFTHPGDLHIIWQAWKIKL